MKREKKVDAERLKAGNEKIESLKRKEKRKSERG